MQTLSSRILFGIALWTLAGAVAGDAGAARSLGDYRYFRALSIDLSGRIPTRAEVAAFEADGFDLDGWIEQHLAGPAYAQRLRRIYTDLLRLEIGSAFQFSQSVSILRRQTIQGPNGKDMYVYYRIGQRRQRPETDGTLCLSNAETGLQFPGTQPTLGTPIPVTQATLDKYTKVVKPWWLYRDYRAASPSNRYDAAAWATLTPGFAPGPDLLMEPDGTTATTAIRVCNEETGLAATGKVYASGRTVKPPAGTPPPYGRIDNPPFDSAYAIANSGKPITCHSQSGLAYSADCGCGAGLERCIPGSGHNVDPPSFALPSRLPLGADQPFDQSVQSQGAWARFFWGQEAAHFFDHVFTQDRDFREVLSGRYTMVNGPLAQFYRDVAPGNCCGQGVTFGYVEPEPLLDPASLPADLLPHDVSQWRLVADRGAHASGILTMPIFLTKYGTRRARAHVLWNAFACKDFIAGKIQLMPSTQPDLTKREGCNTCHATLEPLSAYFARIQESSWTFLPPATFPVENAKCAAADPLKMSGACTSYYDPAFSTPKAATLRGAYSSMANADAGPAALAKYLTSTSQFQSCVAQNVASSFLGRSLTPDDAALQQGLADVFASQGYTMRALVRALVKSEAYRSANNLTSSALRGGGGQ